MAPQGLFEEDRQLAQDSAIPVRQAYLKTWVGKLDPGPGFEANIKPRAKRQSFIDGRRDMLN